MEFTQPRATFEETLEFANLVREAGGGSPLDALMPAVPGDSSRCLIAQNLNFNSRVDALGPCNEWIMLFADCDTRDAVAEKVGLQKYDGLPAGDGFKGAAVILPPEIGQVAQDFDAAEDELRDGKPTLYKEFEPYIEASVKEAYASAEYINEETGAIL